MNPNDEVWKKVAGYPNYMVSNHGRVMNYKRDRVLKGICHREGYRVVNLSKGGVVGKKMIHRLVAIAFIPNLEGKLEVNHKDKVRDNNIVENLEWVTAQENTEHGISKKYKFIDPAGKVVEIFNLCKFCRESDTKLNQASLVSVHLGKKPQHKGWRKA